MLTMIMAMMTLIAVVEVFHIWAPLKISEDLRVWFWLPLSKVVISENSPKQFKLLLSPGSCPLCWNFASFCLVCKHAPKFYCSVSQFCLQLLGLVEDFQFFSFNMSTNTTWYIGWLSQLLSLICAYFNGIIFNSPDFSFLLVYLKDEIF